jgi:type VI secretion system secreted protein VgrG
MSPIGTDQPLEIRSAKLPDRVVLTGFRGTTGLSEPYRFELDLSVARPGLKAFSDLLGQPACVQVRQADGRRGFFHGIIQKLRRADQDRTHIHYQATLVPRLWLLGKRQQSRIFQQQSVPDILAAVFEKLRPDLDFRWHRREEYHPRDYCVQYRESDLAFASRLMEEEGIYYYFEHGEQTHKLIVTDNQALLPAPESLTQLPYNDRKGSALETVRVFAFNKGQELCSSAFALWDQCFELAGPPGHGFQTLESRQRTIDTVKVGAVEHHLNLAEDLEVYDFPGGFAKDFDSINPDGGVRPDDLRRISQAGTRRVGHRAEAEAASALHVDGASTCALLAPGVKFGLTGLDDDAGQYYVTRVEHRAQMSGERSGTQEIPLEYENLFTCLPSDLPYRPRAETPKPTIQGVQTATVVGPAAGENGTAPHIDKYGRVKVQFHWDRQRKFEGHSSCWVRVGQAWAGPRWGAFFWPRPGHEVIVAFENGDPDCPIITGSVYNAANMPPFELPGGKLSCGFKSCTAGGDPLKNYNGMIFHDQKDHEFLEMHSEGHEVVTAEGRRFSDCPGPIVETFGTPFFPLPGSGSGGGDDPPKHIQKGESLQSWLKGAGKLLAWRSYAKKGMLPGIDVPARTTMTSGDSYSHNFMGKSITWNTWGPTSLYNFCDPAELAENAAFKKLGEKFPTVSKVAKLMYSAIPKLGPEPGGNFTMSIGKSTSLSYLSDSVDVKRACNSYELKGDLGENAAAIACTTLVAIGYLASAASTYLGRRFNALSKEGEVEAPTFSFVLCNLVATKAFGILYELESLLAKKAAGEKKKDSATEEKSLTEKWLKISTATLRHEVALNQVRHSLLRATGQLNQLTQVLGDITLQGGPLPVTNQVHDTAYSLSAKDITITAHDNATPPRGAGRLTLQAFGTAANNNGTITIGGTRTTHMNLESRSNSIVLTQDGGNDRLSISNTGSGALKIRHNLATVALQGAPGSEAIELALENPVFPTLTAKINLTAGAMVIQYGWDEATSSTIKLDPAGILLKKGTSTITVAPESIELTAPNIKIDATAKLDLKALAVDVEAATRGTFKAALDKVGG